MPDDPEPKGRGENSQRLWLYSSSSNYVATLFIVIASLAQRDAAIQPFDFAQGREPVERLDHHGALRAPRDDKVGKHGYRMIEFALVWFVSFVVLQKNSRPFA